MAGCENSEKRITEALWSQSGYLSWFTADTAFGVSGAVNSFVLSLLVISATGSPAQAGVVASINLVVAGVFQFFGGWVQDFFDRRVVAIWRASTGIALFAVGAILVATDTLTFLTASVFAVAIGVRAGLTGGVTDIMLRAFIEPRLLSKAMSVNQARDAVVEFGVAPFAGALLQLGRVFPWMFNVVANTIGLLACFFLPESISRSHPQNVDAAEKLISFEALLAGFKTVFSLRLLRVLGTSGNVMFAVFNGAITVTVWHILALTRNATVAGLTNSMVAIGIFVGAALAVKTVNVVRGGVIALLAYSLPVISTALLLLFHSSPWSVLFLLPAMALLPAGSAAVGSLQMLVIPDKKLGRAFSAVGILELIFGAVTTTVTGFLYACHGYMATLAVCVVVMVLCLVHVASISQIRRMPRADGLEAFAASISSRQR